MDSIVLSMNEDLSRIVQRTERCSVSLNASRTQLCEVSRLTHKNFHKTVNFDSITLKYVCSFQLTCVGCPRRENHQGSVQKNGSPCIDASLFSMLSNCALFKNHLFGHAWNIAAIYRAQHQKAHKIY